MKRKFASALLAVPLVLSTGVPLAFARTRIPQFATTVRVNGVIADHGHGIVIREGKIATSFMPESDLRRILSKAGYRTVWEGKTKTLNLIGTNVSGKSPRGLKAKGQVAKVSINGKVVGAIATKTAKVNGQWQVYFPVYAMQKIIDTLGGKNVWEGAKHQWTVSAPVVLNAGTFGPSSGSKLVHNNVVIGGSGVTVRNLTVDGNLYVNPGKFGSAYLNNVKVNGAIVVMSGATHSIHLTNVDAPTLVVNSTSAVHIVTQGSTQIAKTQIAGTETQAVMLDQQSGSLGAVTIQSASSVSLSGSTPYQSVAVASSATVVVQTIVVNLQVTGSTASVSISSTATVSNLSVSGAKSTVSIAPNAKVVSVTVITSTVNLTNDGTISDLHNSTGTQIKVSGQGSVKSTTGGNVQTSSSSTTPSSGSSGSSGSPSATSGGGSGSSNNTGSTISTPAGSGASASSTGASVGTSPSTSTGTTGSTGSSGNESTGGGTSTSTSTTGTTGTTGTASGSSSTPTYTSVSSTPILSSSNNEQWNFANLPSVSGSQVTASVNGNLAGGTGTQTVTAAVYTDVYGSVYIASQSVESMFNDLGIKSTWSNGNLDLTTPGSIQYDPVLMQRALNQIEINNNEFLADNFLTTTATNGLTELWIPEKDFAAVLSGVGAEFTGDATGWSITAPKQLPTPTGLTVDGTTVTWNPVPDASGYNVTIYQNGQLYTEDYTQQGYTCDLSTAGLLSGTYTVTVKASGDGTAFQSSAPTAQSDPITITALDTPANLQLNGTVASWSSVKGAGSYNVTAYVYSTASNYPQWYDQYNTTSTSFDFSKQSLPAGVYTFSVSALPPSGSTVSESVDSAVYGTPFTISPNGTPLDAPTDVTLDGTKLSWSPVKNADSYNVTASVYGPGMWSTYPMGTFAEVFQGTSFDLSDILSGLPEGVYLFSVVANAPSGSTYVNSEPSAPSTPYTIDWGRLLAPNGIAVKGSTISWNPVAGATSYGIQAFDQDGTTPVEDYQVTSNTSFDISTLNLPAGTYVFGISAQGALGKSINSQSASSGTITITIS